VSPRETLADLTQIIESGQSVILKKKKRKKGKSRDPVSSLSSVMSRYKEEKRSKGD